MKSETIINILGGIYFSMKSETIINILGGIYFSMKSETIINILGGIYFSMKNEKYSEIILINFDGTKQSLKLIYSKQLMDQLKPCQTNATNCLQ